jgi:glucans biosynthesis protein C
MNATLADAIPPARLHYLDTLRGFIMTFGVVLHASLWSGVHHWLPAGIAFLSSLFRMKMFALLAGYFAALIVSKKGVKYAVKERAIRFGVPAIIFIAVFNPLTSYLWYTAYGHQHLDLLTFAIGNFTATGEQDAERAWHLHIWFLIILTTYALLIPLLCRAVNMEIVGRVMRWVTRLPQRLCLLLLGLALSGSFVVGRLIHFVTTQQVLHDGPYNYIAQAAFCYIPYFWFGMLAFKYKAIFGVMHKIVWSQTLVSFVLLWVVFSFEQTLIKDFGFPVFEAVRHFASAMAGFYICCILFSFFANYLSAKNCVGDFMSRASYTVYLFHMLVLVLVQQALRVLNLNDFGLYILSIPVAYGACLMIHSQIVERTSFMEFLFNGKISSWRESAPRRVVTQSG